MRANSSSNVRVRTRDRLARISYVWVDTGRNRYCRRTKELAIILLEAEKGDIVAKTILKRLGIKYLRYMTSIDNIPSLLQHGILAYSLVDAIKLPHQDIASPSVQSLRGNRVSPAGIPLHHYVPLYFGVQTPMQYVITHAAPTRDRPQIISNPDLVFIDVDATRVFRKKGTLFTDGNAASSSAHFYSDPEDLDKLDWEVINCPGGYHASAGRCYRWDWKLKKSSEVLVLHSIAPKLFSRLVLYDLTAVSMLKLIAPLKGVTIQIPLEASPQLALEYFTFDGQ